MYKYLYTCLQATVYLQKTVEKERCWSLNPSRYLSKHEIREYFNVADITN